MFKGGSDEKDSGWLKPILLAFCLVFVVRTFVFTPVIVDGASMEPTLHDREKIIVSKTISWMGEVQRGDIVIIKDKDSKTNYVKRVIGLPGDILEMKDDELFINHELVMEPYLNANKKTAENKGGKLTEDFGPLTVPEKQYFVMGDNRLRSSDSRNQLGFIESERMIGKSKFVIFPMENVRSTE
ncbi:signal peptidase I [Lederbergia citrea]|uniref:Signal peptidase I n=1 Tax=Lederbergia citrea TaxID=2833581 RepID=A0A942Z6H3_9BACI|nr:signal peptidase I [Lederbergia citrea]MBS4224307.1 signal peptidase I [Lederbergia citrea]